MSARARRLSVQLKQFLDHQRVYFVHIMGLVRPGERLPSFEVHPRTRGSLEGWEDGDLQLLVDEGRRQFDRQLGDLDRLRGRAQFLFTIGLALGGAIASQATDSSDCLGATLSWVIGLAATAFAVLGAAAIMTGRADFEMIDSAALSRYDSPVLRPLAEDYADMLRTGEETVAARLSLFRLAAVWLILGALAGLISAVVVDGPY
jgi:hypothetical protein